MELGRAPILRALADAEGGIVTAELVARAAELGDIESAATITRAGEALGLGLGNLVNVLNPDVIVVGGGVARMGERLLGPAAQEMHAVIFARSAQRLELRTATLDYAASAGLTALVHGKKNAVRSTRGGR